MGRVLALDELHRMAYELGIPPPDVPVSQFAHPGAPPGRGALTLAQLHALADGELPTRESTLPDGPMTNGELRRLAREAGIPIGNARADAEEREWTAKHEAAHAAVAHSLGWKVTSVDVGAGQTRMLPPDYLHGAERDRDYAVIAAAGSAFTGHHPDRDEFESDRANLRTRGAGHMKFEEARSRAGRLKDHEYVRPLYERLTAALLERGRLEGAELRRVLEAG